ncbi:hypothetical protein NZK27_02060 [Synechococcus sp. FGCU-3]|jgi:hypothetical protein|nr:hypothetical protein [Synechococcus sp. FGCU3]
MDLTDHPCSWGLRAELLLREQRIPQDALGGAGPAVPMAAE